MAAPRRHLLFVPTGPVAEEVDRYRRRFDPVMSSRSPAHVTLVYPEEFDDEVLLRDRVAAAVVELEAFPVVVERLNHNPATGGVWFSLEDPTGGWSYLRETVLSPPFRSIEAEPHVTLVHPRTSRREAEALQALHDGVIGGRLDLYEILYAETSPAGLRILDRLSLVGDKPEPVVAGMLRRDGRVLLGHSHPDRHALPDVWDLPGGHVQEGESSAEALRRELEEELGIWVDRLTEWAALRLGHFDLTLFFVDEWRGEPANLAPDEHDEILWVVPEDLSRLHLAHAVYLPLLRRMVLG